MRMRAVYSNRLIRVQSRHTMNEAGIEMKEDWNLALANLSRARPYGAARFVLTEYLANQPKFVLSSQLIKLCSDYKVECS
jgi:hypothetical protein